MQAEGTSVTHNTTRSEGAAFVKGDKGTCELVQFVSGMTIVGERIVMSYGINDCEAKLWSIKVSEAMAMLLPPKNA